MTPSTPRVVVLGSLAWVAVVVGLLTWVAWRDARPGHPGEPVARWPVDTGLAPSPRGATVVLVAHPRCPCTPASLDELEAVLSAVTSSTHAYVLVVRPEGAAPGFEDGPVWERAQRIPGVVALLDVDGREARRFGARTSGHALAYGPTGDLLFAGGITGAKGCAGDNPARQALIRALGGQRSDDSPIYGCSLTGCEGRQQ